MNRVISLIPYLGSLLFLTISLERLSLPVIGDETIYLVNHLSSLSYLEFFPGFASADHFFGHPSGFPLLLKVLSDLSGNNLSVIRFSMVFFTLCTFHLLYVLIRKNFGATSAVMTLLLLISNQLFITQSVFIQPNMLYIFCGLMGWSFYQNENLKWALVFLTLSAWIRESGIAFTLAIIFLEFKDKELLKNKQKLIYFFIPPILLSLFFIIQKIKFGYFFGNPEFMKRGGFFSINQEKFDQISLNWFMVKSLATSFPTILFCTLMTTRIDKIKDKFQLNDKIRLWLPLTFLSLPIAVFISSEQTSFRIQHTIVNISTWLKIMTGSIFFYLMSERKPNVFPSIIKLVLLTLGMFSLFYFLYQDTSPRDINELIILLLFVFAFALQNLFINTKNKIIIGTIVLCFQLAWLKVPQVPHFTTHLKEHGQLLKTMEKVSNVLKDESPNSIYTTKELYTLFSSDIYGWNMNNRIQSLSKIDDADLILESNYYPRDLDFQKTLEHKRVDLRLIYKEEYGPYFFSIYKKVQ